MHGEEWVGRIREWIEWAALGIELLGALVIVAGDVVRTVALEPTLTNVAVLGLLVLVRTFLSWTLAVEIEGRWPWQAREPRAGADRRPA